MNKQLRMGVKAEMEHGGTYDFIKRYYKKFGRFPSKKMVFTKISLDHLKEDKKYYSKLKKYKL